MSLPTKILFLYTLFLILGFSLDLLTHADKWPTPARRFVLVVYAPAVLLFMLVDDLWQAAVSTWSDFAYTLAQAWKGLGK